MSMIKKIATIIVVVGAIGVVAAILMPVRAQSASPSRMTPEERRARQEIVRQRNLERSARMRPAVDLAVAHDYAGALKEFKELDGQGTEKFARQEAECLLRLGRAKEGLVVIRSAHNNAGGIHPRYLTQTALAVAARDEDALFEALSVPERIARTVAAHGTEGPPAYRAPIARESIPVTERLKQVAIELGRHYNRFAMHIVGDEALRRGVSDPEWLIQYASVVSCNGDTRQALALYELAADKASDEKVKLHALSSVTRLKNYISLVTRERTIEEEEERKHEANDRTAYREVWK
jgi:hypothetical protein